MSLVNKENGLALLAGLSCVAGFAPFGYFPIPMLALTVLFVLWGRADTPRAAANLGFAFGLGLFSAGVAWIYVALHDFGDMPMWLAAPATLLFSAFLALFPALAGYLQARFRAANHWRSLLVMPAAWVLIEWLRGMIFTGFPWLTLGYAHSDTPLAGYAPLLGVYGVSLVAAVCAGLLAYILSGLLRDPGATLQDIRSRAALLILVVLWAGGALLGNVVWTLPYGAPFSVTLVQGNIGQDVKFTDEALAGTLDTYRRLVMQNPAKLTVLPETALPMMLDEVPQGLVDQLREHARRNNGDVLAGVFERDRGGYYNSVIALGASEDAFTQALPHYRKHHLVIFGEFIPLRPVFGWLINEMLNIPMGDLARGDTQQAPLNVAGQRVAVNICYEDVFGEEIITALPEATLLVNVTNDGWYGNSHAAAQHNQMSQFRALETGRMMLRATNTGVTSIIGVNGRVLQQLPQHEQGILQGQVQGYQGTTPYVRWGNLAVLLLIALLLAGAGWLGRKP
ncbi:MAG: apolipoprotein N-acyltransferase [Gallionella sp.]|jgi:apolipoprotein N-acyltransferase